MMPSGFFGRGIGPTAVARVGLPAPSPVAGNELLTNGDFSAWSGDNPVGWTLSAPETGAYYVTEMAGQVRLVTDGTAFGIKQSVLSIGLWYQIAADVIACSGAGRVRLGSGSTTPKFITAPGVYFFSGRAIGSNEYFLERNGGALDMTVDNASCKPLALASLLSSRAYASANCDLSVAVTRTAGTQAGLVARLDSHTTPANFIIAYLDGAGNCKVDKCVAGTYTNVITGAVTYGAGKVLRLVCSGTGVSAYYHGAQVGTTQTVSDAGITGNLRMGLFSTYAANTFTGYVAA